MNGIGAILIVDDEEVSRSILAELFRMDYTIYTAHNGEEALALLASHPEIDAVLLDINMPVMDGFTALKQIREMPDMARLPVLICTQYGDVDMEIKALDLGATDFYAKPFNVRIIKHRIQNLLIARQMEKELETQSRTLQIRNIVDGIDAGIGIYEVIGDHIRALYTNEAFYEMGGYTRAEYHQFKDDALKALPPSVEKRIITLLHENITTGAPIDVSYMMDFPGRERRYRHMRAMPIKHSGTDNPVYLAFITDITQQQQVEHELTRTSERYQALVDSVPGGIITICFSAQPCIAYYNDTMCHMLGYTRDEFAKAISVDPMNLIHPTDVEYVSEYNRNFLITNKGFTCSYRIFCKDGSIKWILFSGAPMGHSEGGDPLLSGVLIDMSKEHLAQEENVLALAELKYRSEHDTLTGLYNREHFYAMAEKRLIKDRENAYMIIIADVVRFRAFNDLYGKEAGDRALCAIARTLDRIIGTKGVYGRLESDHFALCLPEKLLDMDLINETVGQELSKQGIDYKLSMKFGLYHVHNLKVSLSQMCDRATMALTAIKGNVLQNHAYYDDALRKNMLEEQTILDEMNQALEQGQFIVYIQPMYSMSTHKPVSAEVLVRWKHPVKGMIPPGRFIPLFERNGFITKLDYVVWEQACRILGEQNKRGKSIPLSINISRIDLYNPHLCEDLLGLVHKYDIDPSLLELEITESAYTLDGDELSTVLRTLQKHGFRILMDDFGSGYSSLNALKDMPVDILKIDMRFLQEMENSTRAASIVTSVVRMARWLRIPVVAEGVETQSQLDFLRSIGCDNVQGYYFAKPMPVSEYIALLESGEVSKQDNSALLSDADISALWGDISQLGDLFSEMVGCIGVYELTGNVLELQRVNDGYYEMMGMTPHDLSLAPHDMMSVIAKEDRTKLIAALMSAMQTGQIKQITIRRMHADQHWMLVLCRIRFICEVGDNSLYCIAMSDITNI